MIQKLKQLFTLLVFIGLIAGFVSYRAGLLGESLQMSPNGSNVDILGKDSLPPDSARKKWSFMGSSKSMVLTDEELKIKFLPLEAKFDSLRLKTMIDSARIIDLQRKIEYGDIMQSSKSGAILTRPIILYRASDTLILKTKEK